MPPWQVSPFGHQSARVLWLFLSYTLAHPASENTKNVRGLVFTRMKGTSIV